MLKQLNRGDDAPLFTLLNQNGEPVSLAQFRGKKVLVYFYPKALQHKLAAYVIAKPNWINLILLF